MIRNQDISLAYFQPWHHHVLRQGNVVYLLTLKCASSYFSRHFLDQGSWHECQWRLIDWEQDVVFSHIRDPIERRHRAVLQILRDRGLVKQYCKSVDFQILLMQATRLDVHGMLYHHMYPDCVNRIDWIPLHLGSEETKRLTSECLKAQGLPSPEWTSAYQNKTESGIDNKALHLLRHHWSDTCTTISSMYEKDQSLWHEVVEKFNPQGQDWSQISWLNYKEETGV